MFGKLLKYYLFMQGKLFSVIESGNETEFNNLCVIPETGMLFIANENTKIQTYYIPVCIVNYFDVYIIIKLMNYIKILL